MLSIWEIFLIIKQELIFGFTLRLKEHLNLNIILISQHWKILTPQHWKNTDTATWENTDTPLSETEADIDSSNIRVNGTSKTASKINNTSNNIGIVIGII